MKRRSGIVSGWIGMGVGLVSATVFAQGSLTPPGPPAPLMKTLHEVEPRIPVTNLPFTISRPGSYYVTTSLTGVASQCGITIAVDSVTLDLNGFELRGVAGSHHGIWVSGTRRSIAICNGSVRDWGWRGVDASAAQNSRLIGLTAYTNGWGLNYSGLAIGSRSIVRDCVVEANAYHGISAGEGCMLGGCVAGYNGVDGVAAGDGCRVNDCAMSHNTADGLQVANGCRVTGNTCDYNGSGGDGAGIHATGSDNRIEGNSATDNDRGIDVDSGAGATLSSATVPAEMARTTSYLERKPSDRSSPQREPSPTKTRGRISSSDPRKDVRLRLSGHRGASMPPEGH